MQVIEGTEQSEDKDLRRGNVLTWKLELSVMVLSSPEHRTAPTPTPQMGGNLSKFDFYVGSRPEEPTMFNIVSQCDNIEDDAGSNR